MQVECFNQSTDVIVYCNKEVEKWMMELEVLWQVWQSAHSLSIVWPASRLLLGGELDTKYKAATGYIACSARKGWVNLWVQVMIGEDLMFEFSCEAD